MARWGVEQDNYILDRLYDDDVYDLDVIQAEKDLGFSKYTICRHTRKLTEKIDIHVSHLSNPEAGKKHKIIRKNLPKTGYTRTRKDTRGKKQRMMVECEIEETKQPCNIVVSAYSVEEAVGEIRSTYRGIGDIYKITPMNEFNKSKLKMTPQSSGKITSERKTRKYTI